MAKGKLYLIPTTISNAEANRFLVPEVIALLSELNYLIVEEEKTARRFMRSIGIKRPFEEIHMSVLNEHTHSSEFANLIEPALKGQHIGLLSEAGCPAVADPGTMLIRLAHDKKIAVVPLVGPSSILLALMSSGLNGQLFTFHGYLPKEKTERRKKIQQLESEATRNKCTQIFMDTPYRNMHVFEDLLLTCKNQTLLCIAADITGSSEFIRTKSIEQWRDELLKLEKKPVIFLLGV